MRPQRQRKPPQRLRDELEQEADTRREYVQKALLVQETADEITPKSFQEAMKYRKWRLAVEETLESLILNRTWKFVQKPHNINLVPLNEFSK